MKKLNEDNYLALCEDIKKRKEGIRPFIIAIDGRCASGKTTLAKELANKFNASIVHMDDFFLQMHQRTPERYHEPGGNVDRERVEEVLKYLSRGEDAPYQPFDCVNIELGEMRMLPCTDVIIVEGSYSLHPELQKYYHYRIFVTIPYDEQIARIKQRDGLEKIEMFEKKWIPLEEAYLEAFEVDKICEEVFFFF